MKKLSVSNLKIENIMTKKVTTVTFDMTVETIMRLLIQNKVSGAPIVDGDTNELLSVVSEADLIRFAAMKEISAQLIEFVDKLPSKEEVSRSHFQEPFVKVYELFLKTPFRRIPIVDDRGILMGIVSRRDIMRAFLGIL